MNNERTLPKAWKKIDETSEIAIASSGVSKVIYIQDEGKKTEGNGYIDKITGKLYLCKTTNEDVEVTDNFVLATTLNNASRLDNLGTKGQVLFSDFNSVQNNNIVIQKSDLVNRNFLYITVNPYTSSPDGKNIYDMTYLIPLHIIYNKTEFYQHIYGYRSSSYDESVEMLKLTISDTTVTLSFAGNSGMGNISDNAIREVIAI